MDILAILAHMRDMQASDCYLKVGNKPAMRIHGDLVWQEMPAVTDENMQSVIQVLLTDHQQRIFAERPDLDFAFHLESGDRFRINLFRQQGHAGLVARLIRSEDLSFATLRLPHSVQELASLNRGLVLITGATGSGKSTTLASLIHAVNQRYPKHIMTIEDPIEFIHEDNKSIINQREVGYDTLSFADALRHVVRQSPDVILIGELRDTDSILTAVSAAQTGHLVFSTLHTVDVFHTLDRLINYFPDYLKSQIRQELALSLEAVVCMRLLRRADAQGRVPALEIMRTTPSIKKALAEGEFWKMKEFMQSGEDAGMQTFNQALLRLYQQEVITFEEALQASSNPEEFKLNAQGMFTGTQSIKFFQSDQPS